MKVTNLEMLRAIYSSINESNSSHLKPDDKSGFISIRGVKYLDDEKATIIPDDILEFITSLEINIESDEIETGILFKELRELLKITHLKTISSFFDKDLKSDYIDTSIFKELNEDIEKITIVGGDITSEIIEQFKYYNNLKELCIIECRIYNTELIVNQNVTVFSKDNIMINDIDELDTESQETLLEDDDTDELPIENQETLLEDEEKNVQVSQQVFFDSESLDIKKKRILSYVSNVYFYLNNPNYPYYDDFKEPFVAFKTIEERLCWAIGIYEKLMGLHPEHSSDTIMSRQRIRAVCLLISVILKEFPELDVDEKIEKIFAEKHMLYSSNGSSQNMQNK